jgi:MinD-like ATPase involved in chromosome partitioning or flagellar assembly
LAQIVSFYSYKGGVGRSLSLANTAALLASKGRKVVCIDFDLEAGGLHTIFGVEPREIRFTLLDLLIMPSSPDLGSAMVNLTDRLPANNSGGKLWLLPTVSEAEKVVEAMEVGRDIPMLLGGIINDLIELYLPHYILVDSRSGFAELASATILKAERLVCVLRPNRQNADGLRILLDILQTLPSPPETLLVLSQVPDVAEAAFRVSALQNILGLGRKFDVKIPYAPELALEESVAAIVSPDSSLARCYMPIVDWLERGKYD